MTFIIKDSECNSHFNSPENISSLVSSDETVVFSAILWRGEGEHSKKNRNAVSAVCLTRCVLASQVLSHLFSLSRIHSKLLVLSVRGRKNLSL